MNKPHNCVCEYPDIIKRNGSGHDYTCPVHTEWEERGGFRPMSTDDHPIFKKIEEGTVTADDFNSLIAEATPEATRDRMRRRSIKNATDSHQDNADGHQPLDLPTFADRVQPKRERSNNTQMHGRGKMGHRHSARSQRGKPKLHEDIPERFEPLVRFIIDNIGKDITESVNTISDKRAMQAVISKMMSVPDIDREWLHTLSAKLRHERTVR